MKKIVITSIIIITIIGGIIGSLYMMEKSNNKIREEKEIQNIDISEKITDECTEEFSESEKIQLEEVEEANSDEEEKVSPNAVIEFQKFYKDCEHTTRMYEKISSSLVNATRQEIEERYNKWILKEFSKDKIVLFQENNGTCGEHYMLRDINGKINIYKLDENGNETLLNETEIATEYLTEMDMIDMKNGLIVYGKDNLNQLLEDFE